MNPNTINLISTLLKVRTYYLVMWIIFKLTCVSAITIQSRNQNFQLKLCRDGFLIQKNCEHCDVINSGMHCWNISPFAQSFVRGSKYDFLPRKRKVHRYCATYQVVPAKRKPFNVHKSPSESVHRIFRWGCCPWRNGELFAFSILNRTSPKT